MVEPLIQNTPRVGEAPEPRRQPPGTVERILNVRERNYVVAVCQEAVNREKKEPHKLKIKLAKISEIVAFKDTLDYIHEINDAYEDQRFEWRKALHLWNHCRKVQDGSLSLEDFQKKFPGVNPTGELEKPARRQPEPTPAEMRGAQNSYFFPSKLDGWIQDCLKSSTWEGVPPEFVAETCSKFGISDE